MELDMLTEGDVTTIRLRVYGGVIRVSRAGHFSDREIESKSVLEFEGLSVCTFRLPTRGDASTGRLRL